MESISLFDALVLSHFASIAEWKPYPPSKRFDLFIRFMASRLASAAAEERRKEWNEAERKIRDFALPELSSVPLSDADKEELVFLILCGEAKEKLPGWWRLFEENLAKLN